MKYISVPLTQQAMERLDYDCCKLSDLFITLLNGTLHICINDFEDEYVTDIRKLKHMARLLSKRSSPILKIHS